MVDAASRASSLFFPRFATCKCLSICAFLLFHAIISLTTAQETAEENAIPTDYGPLGPLVINHDGTARRISNWHDMTADEQRRTADRIIRRNRARSALRASAEGGRVEL